MCADKSMILSISTKIILKCTLNLSSISLKKKQKTNIICHVSVIKVMYPSVYDFICCKNHIQLKKKIERRKKIEYSI